MIVSNGKQFPFVGSIAIDVSEMKIFLGKISMTNYGLNLFGHLQGEWQQRKRFYHS